MKTRWGSFHFLRRGELDDGVDSYKHGPSDLRVAYELLALAGKPDLALRLEEIQGTAYERDRAVLEASELDEIIEILSKVSESVQATLVDDRGLVLPSQLDELRRRSTVLELGSDHGHIPEEGVSEGLSRVYGVLDALMHARARGLSVALN